MLFDAVHLFLWIDGRKHPLDRPFQMVSTSRV